jgi:HPt (histidine-containing phosphotransfer) domain-containing protein
VHSVPRVDNAVLDQLRALGGNALVERLVTLFFESSKGYVEAMGQGLDSGSLERVETAAHTLKSGAGSLGARAVYGLADEVEIAAREGKIENTRELFEELSDVYEKTCAELACVLEA